MLSERWPVPLLPRDEWRPYPTADDRVAWGDLPDDVAKAFVAAGEVALDLPWPRLRATTALDFVRTGERGSFEGPHFLRRGILRDLAFAECVEGQGRFVDGIVDALWSICEESWWGWPAALGFQQAGPGLPDVVEQYYELGAGETVALVAWVRYLLGDRLDTLSPLINARMELEGRRRVIDPFLARDDYWWATSTGNWNTWCHSNALAAALLLEADEHKRGAVITKCLRGLDHFLAGYSPDGGCTEGPTYWTRAGGALFEFLELLESATGGRFTAWDEPLIGEIGRFILRARAAGDWYVNFADGGARLAVPGPAIFRFGRRIGDEQLARLGAEAAQRAHLDDPRPADGFTGNPTRTLPALFGMAEWLAAPAKAPLLRDVWLPEIQVMAARDRADDPAGLFVAAKGGHNDEHHNHNDVGNLVAYLDGEPMLIDAGVGAYTAKTFGGERYTIWTMQSGWHNTPVVNGHDQRAGLAYRANDVVYVADDDEAWLAMDLSAAYPAEAGLDTWRRTVALRRGRAVEVSDVFRFADGAPGAFAVHFLTACEVDVAEPGVVVLRRNGVAATLRFDAGLLDAAVDVQPVDAENLRMVWGDVVRRVRLEATRPLGAGEVTVSLVPGELSR